MAHGGPVFAHRTALHGSPARGAAALLIGTAFGLSTLITPLYLIYQQQYGFSQITLTLIYAAYAAGNVSALLFLGRISDHAGRRPAALMAVAILFVAALVFLFAEGVAALYIARILSGLGIGTASGTGNAWLAELVAPDDKRRAAIIGTSANFIGLGLAALLSGILAQYAPLPLQLSFVVYLGFLCGVAVLVWFAEETVRHSDQDKLALRPKLSLPREIRGAFVAPAITGFGLMALVGFYAALMPSILAHDLHIANRAAAGLLFFELAMVVAAVIVLTERLASRTAMISSLALMIPAAAAVVVAQVSAMLWVMIAATAIVAVSSGLGYRGSLQVINEIAPGDRRAAVVSSYFICCFVGNALPVVGIGILSSVTNTTIADSAFAAMIAVFAGIALVFAGLKRR